MPLSLFASHVYQPVCQVVSDPLEPRSDAYVITIIVGDSHDCTGERQEI